MQEMHGMVYNNVDTTGASLFYRSPHASQQADHIYAVKTTKLDDILLELEVGRVDFLKLDCEGCEYSVLPTCNNSTLDMILHATGEIHANPWTKHRFGRTVINQVHAVMCARRWKMLKLRCE